MFINLFACVFVSLLFSFRIVGLTWKHLFSFSPSCSSFLNKHALTCLIHGRVTRAGVSGFKAMEERGKKNRVLDSFPPNPYPLSKFDTILRVTLTIEIELATRYSKHLILKILQERRRLNWVFSGTNKKVYFVWL